MAALKRDSIRFGTVPGGTDYALLVDGLAAERDQGITIDVAYRFFETPRRRFILADAPGHEQYTRNMVTGGIAVRPGGAAGRRAQGPAGADPPPRRDRLAARHSPGRAGGEQDGPGRLRPGRVRQDRHRLLRAAGQARPAGGDRHSGLRARRRQRHRPQHAHALVFRHHAADRAGRRRTHLAHRRACLPHAGAACLAPGPHVPRLCRHGRHRDHPPRRRRGERDVRRRGRGQEHRHHGRRTRGSGARPGRDARPRSRDRRIARRRAGGRARAAAGRPGDRLGGVDGRDAAVPWPRLPVHARHARRSSRTITEITNRLDVDTLGRSAGAGTGAERDRPRDDLAGAARRLRALRRQPRTRRLHPDRPAHAQHRRCRHGDRPARRRRQHPLAPPGRAQGGARRH